MNVIDRYNDGELSPVVALAELAAHIKLCDQMIADLEEERSSSRSQAETILRDQEGPVAVNGYVLSIRQAIRYDNFDRRAVNYLLHRLAQTHPDIAAELEACRVYQTRQGGLVIAKERT